MIEREIDQRLRQFDSQLRMQGMDLGKYVEMTGQSIESMRAPLKEDAEKAVNALFASVEEALVKDDKVQVIGFGTFEVRTRAARKGRNPQTGAAIEIPASKNPVFKAGKALKDAVN